MTLTLLLILTILILFLLICKEPFTINIGQHIPTIKKNKQTNDIDKKDIDKIRAIQESYHTSDYYETINKIGLLYISRLRLR
jgi:hypothetical protein